MRPKGFKDGRYHNHGNRRRCRGFLRHCPAADLVRVATPRHGPGDSGARHPQTVRQVNSGRGETGQKREGAAYRPVTGGKCFAALSAIAIGLREFARGQSAGGVAHFLARRRCDSFSRHALRGTT